MSVWIYIFTLRNKGYFLSTASPPLYAFVGGSSFQQNLGCSILSQERRRKTHKKHTQEKKRKKKCLLPLPPSSSPPRRRSSPSNPPTGERLLRKGIRFSVFSFFRERGLYFFLRVSLFLSFFSFVEGMTRYVFSLPNARSYYIH